MDHKMLILYTDLYIQHNPNQNSSRITFLEIEKVILKLYMEIQGPGIATTILENFSYHTYPFIIYVSLRPYSTGEEWTNRTPNLTDTHNGHRI